MNVCKRITALLMALCLVFQLVPAYAGAAETGAAIQVTDTEAYPGSYAHVEVDASGLTDLASLDLEIYYDSDVLQLNSYYNGYLLSGSVVSVNTDTPGVIRLSAAWSEPVSDGGRLLNLTFEVSSDCAPGKTQVKAAVGDAYDVHLHPAAVSGGTGTVTVLQRPTSMGQFSTSLSFPDGATFSQGDRFTVTLYNSYNSFASADFTLEYDSNLLELQSVELRSDLTVEGAVYSVNTAIAGLVRISYASVSEISTYSLADCVFKVREDTNTTTSLTFKATDVYSINLIPYEPGTATRTITLKKIADTPDYPQLYLSEMPDTVGQEGTSALTLEAGANVAAADFTVRYDPQVYACLEVAADENLSKTGGMVVINPAYDEGVIRFSYINESEYEDEIPLVKILWKCLSSPAEHVQVKPGGSNVVNLNFGRVNLDYVVSTHCVFESFHAEPSCTVDGEDGLRCNACGEKRDITVTPPTGHHYGAAVTPPTCLEQGYTTYTCPDCGDSYVGDYTQPAGHSFGQWYVVTPATCTESGMQKHDCRNCNHTETEVLPAMGHSYKNGTCIRCGALESYLEEGKCGDTLYWRMGTDGTLVIFGTGDMYDFAYYETGPWSAYKDSITKVIVSEGAATVGSNAFKEYAAILSVEFPDSLRELRSSCFSYCKGLTEADLSGNLKQIGSSAFSGCETLVSVTLPEGLESIGSSAFSSCGLLKGIVIPDSVTSIGSFAFSNCRNMEYANIPEGVTSLGTMAFYSCRALKEIVIPESMISIGEYAFENCASLTSLTIPAGVESIASRAFLSCTSLKEIFIYSKNCTIAENVFTATTTLFCYEGSTAQAHGRQYGIPWCAAPLDEELGHRYTSTVKEPTCTAQGWTVHTCSRCNSSYEDSFVEMLPHSYGEWYTVTPAGCTEDGTERHDCIACDHYETRVLNKLGHDYVVTVTDPTCTAQGYTTHACSRCADTYVDSYVAALGHSYGGWYTVTAPSCTADGYERRDCERCDHYETNDLVRLGHDYVAAVTEPTCVDRGYTTHTCSRCDDTYVDSYVAALGHSYGDWYIVTAPTCTSDGTERHDCVRCEHSETQVLSKLGHDYVATVTAPTCTEKGCTTHDCSRCDSSYVDSYVDALGHDYGEWITDKAPTCTAEGSAHRECSRCDGEEAKVLPANGHSYTSKVTAPTCTERGYTTHACHCGHSYVDTYVNPLGHDYKAVVTAPTCLEQGYTTYTCSRCGDSYVDNYVTALGHDMGPWSTERESTCTEEGQERRDCTRCDHFETRALPLLDHSYSAVVTKPTCLEQGYTTYTCHCGDSYVADYTAALGHDWDEGTVTVPPTEETEGEMLHTCLRCGATKTEVIPELEHVHSYSAVVTAPTCTDAGYTTHTCRCGDSYVDSPVAALGHDYKQAVTPPSCEEAGYTTYVCSRCDDHYTDNPVAALGHDYGQWITDKAPTCTEDGSAHRECSRCDSVEIKALPAAGHSYTSKVTVPTCLDRGYTTHTCHCGHSYVDSYTNPLGHDYKASVTAPTCTEQGYTTYTCSRCGDSYVDSFVNALGHDYGEWITDEASSCTEEGSAHRECSRCDSRETKPLPATGHSYSHTVTAPACEEQGYTTHTCHCGHSYVDSYVAALGHDWDEGTVTVPPTEESEGEMLHTCLRCGETKTEVIPELGHTHSYTAAVTAPTCTERGYTAYTCRCGDKYTDNYVDALGHSYGDWYTEKAATCTADGSERHDCERCDLFETRVLTSLGHDYKATVTEPACEERGYTTYSCSRCDSSYTDHYVAALGHDYDAVVTEPTCTEDGFTTHTCSRCADIYKDTPAAALGHDWDEGVVKKQPTEEETGEMLHTCLRCGETKTEIIPELGHTHSYSTDVTEPTCTQEGYTTYTCRCGHTMVMDRVAALGHAWDEGVTTIEPTEQTEGEVLYTCTRCGETKTEVLPALDHIHSYTAEVTDPTCTEEGYTTYTCSCGNSYMDDYTDALGHDYQDGKCTHCGEADPDYEEPTEPTEPEEPEQPALSGVYRIAGADRIGTSLGIADQLKAALGVQKFDAVIVASALNFPDALTGSYLAAVKNAPILLTYEAAHPQIRAYIQENLVPGGMVYILGGEGAVSANFATGLNGFNVKRVAGSDRFGTNLEIMKEAGVRADQPVLIATALNFADSLSASAAGLPMVLVYGSLREDQKEFLATTSRNFIIIGGTSAVSEELETELRAIGSVDRLAGAGRYQTSVMVAQRFVKNPDAVVLAYARNFPDGLCGGPLAYALNAPLILTDNYDPATADAYVQGITAGFVAGGSGLISDDSVKEIFDLATNASVPLK